jgi:hypothetical protein
MGNHLGKGGFTDRCFAVLGKFRPYNGFLKADISSLERNTMAFLVQEDTH